MESSAENPLLKQLFSIPLGDDKHLVYAPLKKIAFIANPSLVNLLLEEVRQTDSLPSGNDSGLLTRKKPEAGGGFIPLLHDLDFFSSELPPEDPSEPEMFFYDSVVLLLTNNCNLRCSYCYACSGDVPNRTMPWEIAKAGIDYVLAEVVERDLPELTVGFHGGGEPTLNRKVLTRAVAYARNRAKETGRALTVAGATNGCLSRDMLDFILENFSELSISLDGLPSIQNCQRPAIDGRASFPRVEKTLDILDEAGFSYGLRMTVTDQSVHLLADSVAFICERFSPARIQVEPVYPEGRASERDSLVSDPELFIEQFLKGRQTAAENNIDLFYSAARPDVLTNRFCTAACRALVVTPEGDVTTCFEVTGREHPLSRHFFVGRYTGNDGFAIDETKRAAHRAHTSDRIAYCEACFCKWHCAGDCTLKTCPQGNNTTFQPTERCTVNQALTRELLLEKIRDNGGTIWVGS